MAQWAQKCLWLAGGYPVTGAVEAELCVLDTLGLPCCPVGLLRVTAEAGRCEPEASAGKGQKITPIEH